MDTQHPTLKNYEKCDRVAFAALSLAVFSAIVAFLPGGLIPLGIFKGYAVLILILISFIAWLLGRLIEGAFHIPWTPILAGSGVLALSMLLSAIFSHTSYLAFFGEAFDQGTFAVFGGMLLGLFLASCLFTRQRLFVFAKCFFVLYAVLGLFQLVHIFFPQWTSMLVFYNKVDSPVGVWSDFAFLSGGMVIGSLILLELSRAKAKIRMFLLATGILGLFFVALANVIMVWVLLGAFSVAILVYMLLTNRLSEYRRFPFLAFGLSLIALLFIFANSLFGGMLGNLLKTSYVDVHPNIQSTLTTATASVRHNPVFGAGPNSFLREWLVNRPLMVNGNMFWDVPFSAGSSLLLTVGILGGVLGILAMLFFLFGFGMEAIRKGFAFRGNGGRGGSIFGLLLFTLYFVLSVLLFSPSISITMAALACIGIFAAVLREEGLIPVRTFNFLKERRTSLIAIVVIVLFLLASAGLAYAATERFASLVFFEKGMRSSEKGDITTANLRIGQAISLVDLPLYERARTALAERAVSDILSSSTANASSDAVKSSLQNAIALGNASGRKAIALDPNDPANYIALGDMLRILTPLKIDGVLAVAEESYQKAIAIAPNYPTTYLDLAKLYFDAGDNVNARTFANKALEKKGNYTDAVFLLAQIEVADGDTATAIQQIQNATINDRSNPDLYFELGLLRYNTGDFANAKTAFRTTISLNNQYLNAWYYLALTDQKTGDRDEAIAILTALKERLPDNKEVADTLSFINNPAPAPVSTPTAPTKQEKAKKLPLPVTAPKTTTP
jgi:cytochrome c-type biogenesis protein CcmH/NrfG